jgi:hypothetical protein
MEVSFIARFVDAFIGGFFRSMKEKLIDGGLLLGTLLYWLFSGKLSAHLWESITPWIWVLCAIVVWHTIRAAHLLSTEITDEQLQSHHRRASIVLSQYGKPFELPKTEIWQYQAKIIGVVVLVLAVCAVCSYAVWRGAYHRDSEATQTTREQPAVIQPPLAIFAQCDMSGLPVTIPPHERLRVVPLNPKRMKTTNWGSYDIPNDTDKPQQWPDKRKLEESKKKHNFGVFDYRCGISNHGQVNVLDVAMPMRFWFGNKGGEENAVKFTPIISPLDAGHSAALYFVNDCPINVSGILPDQASLLVVGEMKRRSTKLNLPNRNPIDPIMMWFPTKVRWIGGEPCE